MQTSTSIRVAKETRDLLRALAAADDVTLDEELVRLIRAERQRRLGAALAESGAPDADAAAWERLGVRTVGDDARG